MSAAEKINNINTHVVDILGSTKGRDQPIMKMDKAVELVKFLGEDVLSSDDYVFFDPFCKAGEILLATALVSTLYRKGKHLVSQDEVAKELYKSNRYFALAPDERHYYLSRRTFYGNEKSQEVRKNCNIRNGAYLSENDGRFGRDKFNKELSTMLAYIKEKSEGKKIIAVGNPPYQENDGGGDGSAAKPIYNLFIESLEKSEEISQFLLVIPSRWFKGGRGLDTFRRDIMRGGKIKSLFHFDDAKSVFPTVSIRGGVCFLNWDREHQGKTNIVLNGTSEESIELSNYDIIIPHQIERSIVNKILKKSNSFLSEMVWSRNPFGISEGKLKDIKKVSKNEKTISCVRKRRQMLLVPKSYISKNKNRIDDYKVAFPKAGSGSGEQILPHVNHFFILKRGQIATETYSIAGGFQTLKEAEIFKRFLQTYFVRFLISVRKPTHNTSKEHFSWVPVMDFKNSWGDNELFIYYGISKIEQQYIKEKVKRCTVSGTVCER